MSCDLKVELEKHLSPAKAKEVLEMFSSSKKELGTIKANILADVSKMGASSIVAVTTDLGAENSSIGLMDKVGGDEPLKRKQAVIVTTVGTSVEAVQPELNSSGNEDYPNTKTSIDEIGNWTKVNKKTGQTDWVHNSGSKVSFYKNGDITLHSAGNLKQVVEYDYILEVGRNFEISSGKEFHLSSKEDMFIKTEMNLFETQKLSKVQKSEASYVVETPLQNNSDLLTTGDTITSGKDVSIANNLSAGGNVDAGGNVGAGGNVDAGGNMSASGVAKASFFDGVAKKALSL